MFNPAENLSSLPNDNLVSGAVELTSLLQESEKLFKTAEYSGHAAMMVLGQIVRDGPQSMSRTPMISAALCYVLPEVLVLLNEEIDARIESGEMTLADKVKAEARAKNFVEKVSKLADAFAELQTMKQDMRRDPDDEGEGND